MANRPLTALVLSHVAFEDLGSLQPLLLERGFSIETAVGSTAKFPLRQAQSCDLLVVLGGPIGVYESRAYPFLDHEIACIRKRLEDQRPILGICLGAQLMAAALGARVYPGAHGSEIGWMPLHANDTERCPEWFAPLLAPGLHVFHWHGDTFDVPAGATRLAGSDRYQNQVFTYGQSALALQFHPEVIAADLEAWYVGHACELHSKGIDVLGLREDAQRYGSALEAAATIFWNRWLDYIL